MSYGFIKSSGYNHNSLCIKINERGFSLLGRACIKEVLLWLKIVKVSNSAHKILF